jgi:hypothetical protein
LKNILVKNMSQAAKPSSQRTLSSFFKSTTPKANDTPPPVVVAEPKKSGGKKRVRSEIETEKNESKDEVVALDPTTDESAQKKRKINTEEQSDVATKIQECDAKIQGLVSELTNKLSSYQETDLSVEVRQHEKTMEELHAFQRDMAAQMIPCTMFPENHIKLLGKLVQDSSLATDTLVDDIHAFLIQELQPQTPKRRRIKKGDEENEASQQPMVIPSAIISSMCPKSVVKAKLDQISSLENYGINSTDQGELSDGESSVKTGRFELLRREINNLNSLPMEIREKVKNRRVERKALRKNMQTIYKELRKVEKELSKLQKKLDSINAKMFKKAEKLAEQQQKQVKQVKAPEPVTSASDITKFTVAVQKTPVVEEKRAFQPRYVTSMSASEMDSLFFNAMDVSIAQVVSELASKKKLGSSKRARRVVFFSRVSYEDQDKYTLMKPYVSTLPEPHKTKVVSGRRALKQEPGLDYEELIYDEVEEEEILDDGIEGEDLLDDEDDEEEDEELRGYFGTEDDYNSEDDEDFVVSDAMPLDDDDEDDGEPREKGKEVVVEKREEKKQTPRKGKKGLVPLILNTQFIGPILTINDDDQSADAILLRSFAIQHFVTERSCSFSDMPMFHDGTQEAEIVQADNGAWKRHLKEEKDLVALCKAVHRSNESKSKLIQDFCEKSGCSKNSVAKQMKEIAVKEKRDGDSSNTYYIKENVLKELDLNIPSEKPVVVETQDNKPRLVAAPANETTPKRRRIRHYNQAENTGLVATPSAELKAPSSPVAPVSPVPKVNRTDSLSSLVRRISSIPKSVEPSPVKANIPTMDKYVTKSTTQPTAGEALKSPPSPNVIRVK